MHYFLTESELASDHYRMLASTDSHRELLVVAASILGDLCDEAAEPHGLDEKRFPNYMAFCDWSRDYPKFPSGPNQLWLYYWNYASYVFFLYEKLPRLTDWDLNEEIALSSCFYEEDQPADINQDFRNQTIETCFALSRWIRGKDTETMGMTPAP